jgi:hypothetical protein
MKESDLQIVDESVNEVQPIQCSLLLRVDTNALYYTIINLERNKFIALEKISFVPGITAVDAIAKLSEKSILKKPFKTVYCAVATDSFTLVPEGLFEKDKKEELLALNHPLNPLEEVVSEFIKSAKAYAVFSYPKEILSAIRKNFFNTRIGHTSVSFIEGVLSQFKNLDKPTVFLQIQMTHFEIVVTGENKLQFYNSFKPKTAEDYIYYLLYTMEQLGLNPETTEVIIYGEIVKNSAIYNLMYKYIRNIRFGSQPEHYEFSYKFNEIPSHYFFNLYSQQLCV